jgi:hypothetical protein
MNKDGSDRPIVRPGAANGHGTSVRGTDRQGSDRHGTDPLESNHDHAPVDSGFSNWDAHLSLHPEATFYHTRIWARIVAAAFPGPLHDASRWIETRAGRSAFPVYEWRRLGGILTTRQSSFPFLYGGPVPRLAVDGTDLLASVLEQFAGGGRSLLVISSPFGPPSMTDRAPLSRGIERHEDSTHILSLPASHEEYWDGVLTTAKRNDVRRLAKQGVVVRVGGTPDEVETVYGFYRQSFARWGGTPAFVYPLSLYQEMIRRGEGHVRLYLAEREGKIAGGAFVAQWNGHVHYHAGYFDHEARSLRPNVLIQERVIRDAIADGCRDYDFLPSGGNRGVEEFKESFGGVRTGIVRYGYSGPLHRLASNLRIRRQGRTH